MRINKIWLSAILFFAFVAPVLAQGAPNARALTVGTCGTQTFPLTDPSGRAAYAPLTQLQNGLLCTNATGGGGGTGGGAVYGPDALGAAPSKPPVLQGLLDGSGNVRTVSPSFPQPIAGTVTIGAPLPAGTNTIGGVTEADGANTALGSKADAANAATGSTAMAIFRQLHADLIGPTPAAQAGPALGPSAALGVVQQDGLTTTLSGSAAGPLTNATYTTGSIPTAGYQSASIQINTIGTGNTIQSEQSNDGTNWYTIPVSLSYNAGNLPPNVQFISASTYIVPIYGAYQRFRVVAYGSGTVTAVVTMKVTPVAPIATYATLNTSQTSPIFASESAANVATSQAPASTTAAVVCAARTGRRAATIQNLGTTQVFLGGSSVTTTTGFLLPGSAGASVTIPSSSAIYGVVGTGTQTVACLETY